MITNKKALSKRGPYSYRLPPGDDSENNNLEWQNGSKTRQAVYSKTGLVQKLEEALAALSVDDPSCRVLHYFQVCAHG